MAVGTAEGAVRLFDADVLGGLHGAPLWERAAVHQMPVTCVAFLRSDAAEDADEEVGLQGLVATGAPDAQLALTLLDAPPPRCSPRALVLLLLLLIALLAAAVVYINAAAAAKGEQEL